MFSASSNHGPLSRHVLGNYSRACVQAELPNRFARRPRLPENKKADQLWAKRVTAPKPRELSRSKGRQHQGRGTQCQPIQFPSWRTSLSGPIYPSPPVNEPPVLCGHRTARPHRTIDRYVPGMCQACTTTSHVSIREDYKPNSKTVAMPPLPIPVTLLKTQSPSTPLPTWLPTPPPPSPPPPRTTPSATTV